MQNFNALQNLWGERERIQSVFEASTFDLLDWKDAKEMYPQCGYANHQTKYQLGSEVVRDAFWSLFKANPVVKPSAGMEAMARVFQAGMATPGYEKLHTQGQGDLMGAAVGASLFGNELADIIPDELKAEMKTASEQAQKMDELMEDIATLSDLLVSSGGNKEVKQEITKQKKAAQKAEDALQAAQAAAETLINEHEGMMVAKMNKAASEAADETEEVMEFVVGFNETAGGEPGYVSPEVARSAMQLLKKNPHLKKVAEFLGWAKKNAAAAWRESAKGRSEFTGYKTQDLQPSSLAAWEYADMVSQSPLRKLQFMTRVVDGGVFHRNYQGEEQKNRGGMIIVRDESGSMGGAPHALAVATEWALLEIAKKEKRPFFSVPFSYYHHVWDAQEATMESVLRHLGHFYNGGTHPWPALMTALNLIDEGELEADILMITDEAFGYPDEEFLAALEAAKKRRPLKIVVVVIGWGTGQVAWADKVILLKDFIEEKDKLQEAFLVVT